MSEAVVKRCACCGASYTREKFDALEFVGLQMGLVLRNCPCVGHERRSTLALEVDPEHVTPDEIGFAMVVTPERDPSFSFWQQKWRERRLQIRRAIDEAKRRNARFDREHPVMAERLRSGQ